MIQNKQFKYINVTDVKDQSFLKLINRSGIESIYNMPIKTLNGKIIGILGVDYVKSPREKFTKDQDDIMHRQSKIIAGYLI